VRRIVFVLLMIGSLLFAVGCGGGSHSSSTSPANTSVAGGNTIVTSGNNVAPLSVDAGPVASSNPSVNVAFTTIVVCAPGSATNCVTIDHIAVDTGSTGLRIPATLLSTLNLQNVNLTTPIAECVQFLDTSFSWGSVKSADVKMGGTANISELASSVPILVLGDPSIPSGASIPTTCSQTSAIGGSTAPGKENDTVAALGANGLLGVGNFQFDCDVLGFANPCASSTPPPSAYYTCLGTSSCSTSAVPTTQQVRNPVSMFTTDNNGVILELPVVPIGGQTSISAGQGSMVFGIGTQSNNGLGSAVVLALDSNLNDPAYAGITTVFKGISYPNSTTALASFLDSGSNGFFFLDQPTSKIPNCIAVVDFYCPASTESLTATNQAASGNSLGVQFNISNADKLSGNNTAFSDLAGPNTSGSPNSSTQAADGFFDWGLPFFYGRNVYVAISGVTPPNPAGIGGSVPAGPFWAY
jgi:hypothetical protein